jgi:hypothetical protein
MESTPPTPVLPTQELPPSAAPPNPPRPPTPMTRRLAWLEPRVRRWWLAAILVLIMFGGFAGDRLWARQVEYRLIHSGLTVQAKIVGAENKINNQPVGAGDMVRLQLTLPDKTEEDQTGPLSQPAIVGNFITVHLDPADHSRWTDRSEATPLLDSLLIGLFALPLIPLLLWISYRQMLLLMRTWRNGSPAVAVVFDRRHSPIAPMSYTLRCSLQNHKRKDLFTVYVPRIAYGLEKGDLIWVILPPKKGYIIAALWMAGGSA